MISYSPSTGGFYHSALAYPALPGDLIEITDEAHVALLAGQQAGQQIVPGEGGAPMLQDRPADLPLHAHVIQWGLILGGFLATVNGGQRRFACDGQAAAFMASKIIRLQRPDPPATINWQVMDGSYVTIAAADFIPLAEKLEAFVQAAFDTEMDVLAGIAAGTITTTAQIDAAAWPAAHD